ncbi:hypothetical protein DFS34DRAFT_696775 [Phlyctochytrium arcticum]|nr:hypothetical protein DFS34DRAFT_696775 [Phlyctochytrium arcticum]
MASTKTTTTSHRDIWSIVKDIKARDKKSAATAGAAAAAAGGADGNGETSTTESALDTTLFFLGAKSSGKSSIILRLLDRDDAPTATVGLEYTFARRTRGVKAIKDVCHIWELAGGVFLADLMTVPVLEANIHTVTFVVVVDLSLPAEAIQTLSILLPRIKSHLSTILDKLESRGSKRPKHLRAHSWKKYGSVEEEREWLDPCVCPVVIIGNKWDLFREMESEKRKLIAKTLRYLAHTHGASLVFVSQKDENTVAKCRQLLTHHAFKGSTPRTMSVDHNKPVLVLAGQDSLSLIGPPPSGMSSTTSDALGRKAFYPWTQWKSDFDTYFPLSRDGSQSSLLTEPVAVDLSMHPEPAIDAYRAQKDEELSRLRRANERKARDLAAGIVNGGAGASAASSSRKEAKEAKRRERAAARGREAVAAQ